MHDDIDNLNEVDTEVIDSDEEGQEHSFKDKIKDLKEKLSKALLEKQEYLTLWQKDKADFINARKRDEQSNQEMIKFAELSLIEDILPILDSFDAAIKSFGEHNLSEEAIKGLQGIYNQMMSVLEKREVKSFGTVGEIADPARYHSVGADHTDNESDDNKVSIVLQKGYEMKGRVVRAAMVRVYSHNA